MLNISITYIKRIYQVCRRKSFNNFGNFRFSLNSMATTTIMTPSSIHCLTLDFALQLSGPFTPCSYSLDYILLPSYS